MIEAFRHLARALSAVILSLAILAIPRISVASALPVDAPRPGRVAGPGVPLPILMYHELGDGPNQLYVRVGEFERQLRYLAREGYRAVRLSEAGDLIAGGVDATENPGDKPVALTFDDGYRSHYTVAYPLLKELGMTATFFVISGRIGLPGYVSWEELREMAAAGMEIGCHSANHLDLGRVKSESALARELTASRSDLEERLGTRVSYFCYPSGRFNNAVVARLKTADYAGAVTTAAGWALARSDPFRLRRVRINRSDSIRAFKSRLSKPWIYGKADGGKAG